MQDPQPSSAVKPKSRILVKLLWTFGGSVLLAIIAFLLLVYSARPKQPIQMALADGRILQIEGVTYGTSHRIGQAAVLHEHFYPWLPWKLKQWLQPRYPQSSFTLDHP